VANAENNLGLDPPRLIISTAIADIGTLPEGDFRPAPRGRAFAIQKKNKPAHRIAVAAPSPDPRRHRLMGTRSIQRRDWGYPGAPLPADRPKQDLFPSAPRRIIRIRQILPKEVCECRHQRCADSPAKAANVSVTQNRTAPALLVGRQARHRRFCDGHPKPPSASQPSGAHLRGGKSKVERHALFVGRDIANKLESVGFRAVMRIDRPTGPACRCSRPERSR